MALRAASLLCVVALCSGCAALLVGAGVGAGGVMIAKGKVTALLDYSVTDIHAAAIQALTDMGLPVEEDRGDAATAQIRSHYSDGKPIRIRIDTINDTTSRVRIRSGQIGSESRAQKLLDEIQARL